jgi:siderophore synthetase component
MGSQRHLDRGGPSRIPRQSGDTSDPATPWRAREFQRASAAGAGTPRLDNLPPDELEWWLERARRRAFGRLLDALAIEGLLTVDGPFGAEGALRYRLPEGRGQLLHLPGPGTGEGWTLELLDPREMWRARVEHPVVLLQLASPEGPDGYSGQLRDRCSELSDSVVNEALSGAALARWNTHLRADAGHSRTLPELFSLTGPPGSEVLALEQWSSSGTPIHPLPKLKVGLEPRDVVAVSPEFRPTVPVTLGALHRDRAQVERLAGYGHGDDLLGGRLAGWMAGWMSRWRQALLARGLAPEEYVPIPLHPWQLTRVVQPQFADQLKRGLLQVADAPTLPCAPTASTRTVVPLWEPLAPHLKLALGARLTAALRTISPRSCQMGPRVSRLLMDILAREAGFEATIEVIPEVLGVHYRRAAGEPEALERQLSAILRLSPASLIGPGEQLVPASALPLVSPVTRQPLLMEIAGNGRTPTAGQVTRCLEGYARTLLSGTLGLYLGYGIALEAHQQNVLAVFDQAGRLQRVLMRDFGGIRIHEPTLRASGWELAVHPDRLTVVEDWAPVREKLVHMVLHGHLGSLVSALAHHYRIEEAQLWRVVSDVVVEIFEGRRDAVPEEFLRRELAALTAAPWSKRGFLRKWLAPSTDYQHVAIENPLAGQGPPAG